MKKKDLSRNKTTHSQVNYDALTQLIVNLFEDKFKRDFNLTSDFLFWKKNVLNGIQTRIILHFMFLLWRTVKDFDPDLACTNRCHKEKLLLIKNEYFMLIEIITFYTNQIANY